MFNEKLDQYPTIKNGLIGALFAGGAVTAVKLIPAIGYELLGMLWNGLVDPYSSTNNQRAMDIINEIPSVAVPAAAVGFALGVTATEIIKARNAETEKTKQSLLAANSQFKSVRILPTNTENKIENPHHVFNS